MTRFLITLAVAIMLAGMNTIAFDFCGQRHELTIPEGEAYRVTAEDIIQGKSYPFLAADADSSVRSVVDLGAHVGEYTIMAAVRWPQATIHAFEPNPHVIPLLRQNCRPYPNVVIHEQAVDAQPRRGKLYFVSIGSVAATIVRPKQPLSDDWERVAVDVDIVGPQEITALAPDVLKIDIEGAEVAFLDAMGAALFDIPRLHIEFHHETARLHIDRLLMATHGLAYARILQANQGELMYLQRIT